MSNAPPLFEIEPFRAEALEGEGDGEMGRRRRSASPSASLTRTRKPWLPRPRPYGPRRGGARSFDGYAPDGAYDPSPGPVSAPEDDVGSGSEYVRWVQFTLNRALGARLPIDGVMRPGTRAALRAFQRRQGLPGSGFIGPDTRSALLSVRELGSSGVDLESEWAPGTHLYKPDACKPSTFMREQTIDEAVTFLRNNPSKNRGVYILTLPSKKWYVGSTINYTARLARHKQRYGNVVVRLLPMPGATECEIRNCECLLITKGLLKGTVTNRRHYELGVPFT
jgi:putative peptidoglycan binding protein